MVSSAKVYGNMLATKDADDGRSLNNANITSNAIFSRFVLRRDKNF